MQVSIDETSKEEHAHIFQAGTKPCLSLFTHCIDLQQALYTNCSYSPVINDRSYVLQIIGIQQQ